MVINFKAMSRMLEKGKVNTEKSASTYEIFQILSLIIQSALNKGIVFFFNNRKTTVFLRNPNRR